MYMYMYMHIASVREQGKMTTLFWLLLILATNITANASIDIGVNYGMQANNLPPPTDVINLYQKYKIGKLRLFDPDHAALQALRGKQIVVSIGVKNEDIPNMAANQEAVNSWFAANIQPYIDDITFNYITVGNEVIGGSIGNGVAAVMVSLQKILDHNNLHGIKVTTVVAASILAASYPPSSGEFTDAVSNQMRGVLSFLSLQGSPLMINVYPYFAYASDPVHIRLDYAQFTADGPVIRDGSLSYSNLFDAIVDAFHSAMEREGIADVDVVISESGWPSAGNGNLTMPLLAQTYNKNFVQHVLKNGTPKRPKEYIEGYIFSMFNENLKPAGAEQNFGLFYPNMQPVYDIFS